MNMLLTKFSSLVISLNFLSVGAFASQYPATYQISRSNQTSGPVVVSRGMEIGYRQAVLDITYSGKLATHKGLKAWVQIHYNDSSPSATFLVTPQAMGHFAEVRITGGCLRSDEQGNCAELGTQQMRDLLIYAQNGSTLNALDGEVAFVDVDGHWDNNSGSNFHFKFPQQ